MINCCYCDPRMDYQMVGDITEYIADEMTDSRYYALLAQQAPTQRAKDLLMEFSADEWAHSQSLMRAYNMLTGKVYATPAITDPAIPEYNEALKQRVIAETNDYKKYGEKYLAACNACLKEMFFGLRTNEAVHAMRMQILLAGG